MFLILYSFFLTFPTDDLDFIPFHHLFWRPHSHLCFPETPLISSSWLGRCRAARSSEGEITVVQAAVEGRPAAPGPTWHVGSEQFEDDRAPFFAIVHSRTNMQCTPTYANAQSEQALAKMLSLMIEHCDVGFGFTEAFRELAHTRMLHSVWFTTCVSVGTCVCVHCFFECSLNASHK